MEIFRLVGRIVLEGAKQATQAIEKVGDSARSSSGQIDDMANSSSRTLGQRFREMGESATNFGTRMERIGSNMQQVGSNIAVPFGTATTAIGVAFGGAVKVAMDFESQMDRVGAISGATASEMDALTTTATELGASTSKSASEVAIGMENLAAMGFEVNDIIGAMPGVISAAEASGADMAQVADVMASSMNAFGLEASESTHIADVLAETANKSAADINDLQYSFKYAAPVASQLGISMEELAAATGIMADSGIRGEQAGTTLRASLLRLVDPPKSASDALNGLGVEITDAQGNMLPFSNIIGQLNDKMSGMTETQKAATLAQIFGTEAVSGMLTIVEAGPEKLNSMTDALENSGGASQRTAEQMKDNLGGAVEEMGGAFETMAISIGNALTPAIEFLTEKITALANWFNNLSPQMQTAIAVGGSLVGVFTALVTGVGLVVGAVGGLISGIGAIATLFGSTATAGTLLAGAFTALTGPVGLTVAALAAVVTGGVALVKNWDTVKNHPLVQGTPFQAIMTGLESVAGMFQSSIPPVDLFGDKVSETTQKSVQSLVDLSTQGSEQLLYLSSSGTEITQEMATSLTGIYNQMATDVIGALTKQKTEGLQQQSEFFTQSSALSEQREAEIMTQTEESYNNQIMKTQEGQARINEIVNTASQEKRSITQAEKDEINRIQQEMLTTGVEAMSQNEVEVKAILGRMKANSDEMNAQMAANVVQKSIEARDGAIQSAQELYTQKTEQITRMRDETGVITEEEATKMIQEAKRAKDESIANANEMHLGVVEEAKAQAGEHVEQVNWETGEIKSGWQVMKDDLTQKAKDIGSNIKTSWQDWTSNVGQKTDEIKSDLSESWSNIKSNIGEKASGILSDVKSAWSDLKSDTSTKFGNILSNAKTQWNNVKNSITKPINTARDNIESALNRIKGFFDNLKGKLGLSINSIKTPRFKLNNWSWNPTDWLDAMPSISVTWAAKGAVAEGVSLLGIGEAGNEAVVPLQGRHMLPMANAISDILADDFEPEGNFQNMTIEIPVVLNGREMARAIVPDMDTELKRQETIRRRGL